ncbi:hypothetical protein [Nocardioides sp. SYSU D00038]|uniref:hypothetical protein n=1 Tax=Nocardioides sp. SYSU D00038 TaxID=2812554 RepID=UPI001967C447|nr:hypothetical protein [Nocardioides sp. SYSU D00038]
MNDTTAPADAPTSGWHPVNVGALVMGLAFVALVGVWALVEGDVVDDGDVRWLLPVPWVLAGAVGLAVTAFHSTRRRSGSPEPVAPPEPIEPIAPTEPTEPIHEQTTEPTDATPEEER